MTTTSIKPKPCPECGSLFHSRMYHKPRKAIETKTRLKRPTRRIKQIGSRTLAYNVWRDTVAIPYLAATFGEVCSKPDCELTEGLEVDHIKGRGSHPELKMVLSNLQLLCHRHHQEKTDHMKEDNNG